MIDAITLNRWKLSARLGNQADAVKYDLGQVINSQKMQSQHYPLKPHHGNHDLIQGIEKDQQKCETLVRIANNLQKLYSKVRIEANHNEYGYEIILRKQR